MKVHNKGHPYTASFALETSALTTSQSQAAIVGDVALKKAKHMQLRYFYLTELPLLA